MLWTYIVPFLGKYVVKAAEAVKVVTILEFRTEVEVVKVMQLAKEVEGGEGGW